MAKNKQRTYDTVAAQKRWGEDRDILMEARACWDSLYNIRKNRERCIRYLYGDQWGDEIMKDNTCMCTEREAIEERGDIPLTNNLIRKLVRTMVGVMRNQNKVPACTANDRDEQSLGDMMSVTLQANWKNNYKKELDARCFEDYLAGGVGVQKETFGWHDERQKQDCWSWWPNVNRMFWNPDSTDFRGWDLSIIGEIHDWEFPKLCSLFVKKHGDVDRLREIYRRCRNEAELRNMWEHNNDREQYHKLSNLDFLTPHNMEMCRVIEIWRKEAKERYHVWDHATGELSKCELSDKAYYEQVNMNRIAEALVNGIPEELVDKIELIPFVDLYWYYRFITPTGEVLEEGESPYDHHGHPYVLKLYPLVNGEVHSFVGDVIDQQRHVNRLISLNDKLIRSSAKGVLMYPMSLLPDDMTPEQLQEKWRDPDSVIFFDDLKNRTSGARPEQVANKLTNIGIGELLQLEMGLMEEITGVNGALQGKPGFAGQSATLYAQQTQNSSTAILDLLESFDDLILRGAEKKVKNIQQYYDEKKTMAIVGKGTTVTYDPELCGDVDYDLNINEVADTPSMRMVNNDILMQMFQLGAINIKQLLENGNWPFTDKLLESIKADEQAAMQQQMMQQGQGDTPMMPNTGEQLQQLQQDKQLGVEGGADPYAVMQAQKMMRYDLLTPYQVQQRLREQQRIKSGLV